MLIKIMILNIMDKLQIFLLTGVTHKKETSKLTLYIPRNIQFNDIDLDIDASKVTIEDLQCNQLEMESDTSKVTIKHLLVNRKCGYF